MPNLKGSPRGRSKWGWVLAVAFVTCLAVSEIVSIGAQTTRAVKTPESHWGNVTASSFVAGGEPAGQALSGAGPWKLQDLIETNDFAATLSKGAAKPLVVYVGFEFLYKSAHIPGALYFGAGRTREGLTALTKWARTVPQSKTVVLYCGCCPWRECPNIRPAFKALRDAGMKNLKLLYIPDNLLRDWINKGYPIEKGS